MSEPRNEEKITERYVSDDKTKTYTYIYTIKCKECEEEFTNEQTQPFGEQSYPSGEYHNKLRAKLQDHKSKVHKIHEAGSACSKCQNQLYDRSGKQFSWYENSEENKKYKSVCLSCLKELEKQGELWDNFFYCRSYAYSPDRSDPAMRTGNLCSYCTKPVQKCQEHQNENGKLIIKHNCQSICQCLGGCPSGKTFQLTQAYMDLYREYAKDCFGFSPSRQCPDCWIKEVKKDIEEARSWNPNKEWKEKKQKLLKELERLNGKNKNDNPERERERERERDKFLNYELELLN